MVMEGVRESEIWVDREDRVKKWFSEQDGGVKMKGEKWLHGNQREGREEKVARE